MKNLFKIFFAVVAFVAYSCATDTTGDLDVQLGNGEGQTIIALSLEESRTQLGEKAGDLYPVYWSEGDKISVNGVESSEADIDESDKTKAYFKVQGVIEAPYYVAYPVAPAGQVLFATEQVHTENTFGNGVSTMYGISATGTSTTLNHLTGVLKVGVTGNATITKAQISTANHAPIAGAFDIDFKNGKLTPSKDSAYTISYLFGEGVALSDEPVYMHIAVPAGVYDELYITLFDNQGGAMYATVKAGDEKPLAVGKVREFKNNIPYKSANYLLINDEASLREFAAQAADLDKDVLLTADIDMTNKEWTPINGFEKVFNGNGHAIKGLSAPFFGVISGSIKSLNLEDVDITLDTPYNDGENTWAYAGALALRINGGNLSYCSTSGKIEVNMEYDNTAASNSSNYNINLAGMVGLIDAATITSCVNRVNLTVKKIFSPAAERTYYTNCGGMFGSCLGTITMNDCHNYGSATLKTTDKTTVATLRFGGIVGFTNGTFKPTNSSNNGDLTLGNLRADNQDNAGSLYVGSITGHAGGATTMTSCTTASAITLEKSVSAVANYYVGPLVGSTAKNITISQCHTYNNAQGKGISLSGSCNQLYTGIVGKPAASSSTAYTHTLTNSSNNTDLLCTSDFKSSSTTYPTGGFSDTVSNAFSNWTIKNFTVSSNIKFYGEANGYVYCSGIVGYWRTKNNTYKLVMENCEFTGSIDINAVFTNRTTVGGIIAYNSGASVTTTNVHNKANITYHNRTTTEMTNYTAIGGITGYTGQAPVFNGSSNSGNITVTGFCKGTSDGAATKLHVGGIAGNANSHHKHKVYVTNTGNITIGAKDVPTSAHAINVAGIIARPVGTGTVLENATNTGNIKVWENVEVTTPAESYVGGILAHSGSTTVYTNAKCVCDIYAIGFTNIGMFSGTAYGDTAKYTSSQVGGTITTTGVEEEQHDGSMKFFPTTTTLDSTNFFKYLYPAALTAEDAEADKVTLATK